jgi:hypothetical protein
MACNLIAKQVVDHSEMLGDLTVDSRDFHLHAMTSG